MAHAIHKYEYTVLKPSIAFWFHENWIKIKSSKIKLGSQIEYRPNPTNLNTAFEASTLGFHIDYRPYPANPNTALQGFDSQIESRPRFSFKFQTLRTSLNDTKTVIFSLKLKEKLGVTI